MSDRDSPGATWAAATPGGGPVEVGPAGDRELMRLWARHRHASLQRIEALEIAARAAQRGGLDAPTREAAECAAHKLAGVLGTFGFPRGTELAREAEDLLRATPVDADRLAATALAMRHQLAEPPDPA